MPLVRTAKEQEQYELLDAGTYEVECLALEEFFLEVDLFGNNDKIRFKFEVKGEQRSDGEPFELSAMCNDKLSESSTLWGWLTALGLSPLPGDDIDLEECIGKHALAEVAIVEGKKAEGAKEAPKYNRIKKLMALPKSRGVKAPTKPVEAASDAQSRKEPDDLSDWLRFDQTGEPVADWTAFWTVARKYKVKREDILKEAGVTDLTDPSVDLFELPAILAKLAVPF